VNIKRIFICLILFTSLSLVTGCIVPDFSSLQPATQAEKASPASVSLPAVVVTTGTPNLSPLPNFVTVIAAVRPSVVAITTEVSVVSRSGRSFTQQGAGSGWIINEGGLIVTNNHVIEGAKNITVTLEDGRTYPSELVRSDPVTDLAIVKINANNLPTPKFGDSSKLQVGEWVITIGNSLGMGISATKGIVSALDVSLSTSPGETLYGLIQTDAAINPGNSGGPLLNLQGEVVGINSAKVAQVGVEGMGYAIGIKEAAPIIDQLIKDGYINRPYLGAGLYNVDQFVTARYKLSVNRGVLIIAVAPGSPAAKSGLEVGDVITAIDNKEINNTVTQIKLINSYKIGQKVQITYWRGKDQNIAYATITQSPSSSQ
jgi:serine protease Do